MILVGRTTLATPRPHQRFLPQPCALGSIARGLATDAVATAPAKTSPAAQPPLFSPPPRFAHGCNVGHPAGGGDSSGDDDPNKNKQEKPEEADEVPAGKSVELSGSSTRQQGIGAALPLVVGIAITAATGW